MGYHIFKLNYYCRRMIILENVLPVIPYNKVFIHCWYNSFASIVTINDSYQAWIISNNVDFVFNPKCTRNLFNWEYSPLYCRRNDDIIKELKNILNIKFIKTDTDIVDLAIECLKNGKYLFAKFDRFYQQGHLDYYKYHNYHFNLIYGYGDNSDFYLLSDWKRQDYLDSFKIDCKSFNTSIIKVSQYQSDVVEFNNNLAIIEKKQGSFLDYKFNIKRIYLNNLSLLNGQEKNDEVNGIQAIKHLYDNLDVFAFDMKNYKKFSSPFYVLAQNEKRNILLMDYLYQNKYISKKCYIIAIELYETLKENWEIISLMFMKYNHCLTDSIVTRIKQRLIKIYDHELKVCELLEQNLRSVRNG